MKKTLTEIVEEAKALRAERDQLKAWKKSALISLNDWEPVRKFITANGAKLGCTIQSETLRILEGLKTELLRLSNEDPAASSYLDPEREK